MHDTIATLVEQFWIWLGITLEKTETRITGEDIDIRIETPDSALVIGMHGKSLESFTHILSRMIDRVTWSFVHVHLEVNDYVKSKEEKMYRFLDSKIALVMSTGRPAQIANLSSYDRKKVHSYISDKAITGLSTHSEGEASERHLVLEYTGELRQGAVPTPPHIHAGVTHTPVDDLSEDGIGI
jgi:predicted RNA-binding protein Jag